MVEWLETQKTAKGEISSYICDDLLVLVVY